MMEMAPFRPTKVCAPSPPERGGSLPSSRAKLVDVSSKLPSSQVETPLEDEPVITESTLELVAIRLLDGIAYSARVGFMSPGGTGIPSDPVVELMPRSILRAQLYILHRHPGKFGNDKLAAWHRFAVQIEERNSFLTWVHDPYDQYVVSGGNDAMSWKVLRTCRNMVLIQVFDRPGVPPLFQTGVSNVMLPPRWLSRVPFINTSPTLAAVIHKTLTHYCGRSEAVNSVDLSNIRAYLLSRTASSWNFQGAGARVRDLFETAYPLYRTVFPERVSEERVLLHAISWTEGLHDTALLYGESVVGNANLTTDINATMRVQPVTPASIPRWVYTVSAVGVGVCALLYFRRPCSIVSLFRAVPRQTYLERVRPWWDKVKSLVKFGRQWMSSSILRYQLETVGRADVAAQRMVDDPVFRANFYFTGLFVPVMEELLKVNWGNTLVIGTLEALYYRDPIAWLFHVATRYFLPTHWRILVHLIVNINAFALGTQVLRPVPRTLYLVYFVWWAITCRFMNPRALLWISARQDLYYNSWQDRVPVEISCAESFPVNLGYVPRQVEPNCVIPPQDTTMPMTSTMVIAPIPPSRVYFWLATNVPAYAVARSPAMVMAGIQTRLMRKPTLTPKKQATPWLQLKSDGLVPFPCDAMDWETIFPTWLSHFAALDKRRYRLYSAVYKQYCEFGPIVKSRIELFPKTDEILLKPDFQLKPRMISNVPPMVQVRAGPYMRAASARLHSLWNVNNRLFFRGMPLYITYGIGLRDYDLDEWMRHVSTSEETHLIVCGDDSVVHHHGLWYCGDASAYDQSQSLGPLQFQRTFLTQLGVPVEIANLLTEVSRWPYVYFDRSGTVSIKRTRRPTRDTGGPDTSLGNSINMAVAWAYALTASSIDEGFLELGFDMKNRVVPLQRVNFLKGSWPIMLNKGVEQLTWTPLPSRLIKMGVIKREPQLIYNCKLKAAVATHICNIIATIWAARYIPLWRVLCQRFPRGSKLDLQWMVNLTERPLVESSNHSLLDYYSNYYEVDVSAFEELECILGTIQFPAFIAHPLWMRMAEVDYA